MGKYTDGGYIDLDREVVEYEGERLTEARAEQVGLAIVDKHAKKRGRPSMSGALASPTLRVRVPIELREALRARAKRDHVPESELVRKALTDLLS